MNERPSDDAPPDDRALPALGRYATSLARRRIDRHRLEGDQRQRPPQRRDARQGARSRQGARLSSERSRPEPAPSALDDSRHSLDRQFRPLHLPDRRGAGAPAVRPRHRDLHVQRHRRSLARTPAHRQLLGKRVDGLVVTARRADKRAPIAPAARGLPIVYVFSHVEDPDALCLLPDDEGGAMLAVRHLAAPRPQDASPISLARATSRRCACARPAIARRWPRRGWRRAGAISCRAVGRRRGDARRSRRCFRARAPRPDALFCGNDQIARGAVDALADIGSPCPRMSLSSVSTIGT